MKFLVIYIFLLIYIFINKYTDYNNKTLEKEILKDIEEKLERDYNYYQQIKQPNGLDKAPEEWIKIAVENTLDHLFESQGKLKPVITLIKKCYNDYIQSLEHKCVHYENENKKHIAWIQEIENEKELLKAQIEQFKAQIETSNKEIIKLNDIVSTMK